MCDLTGLVVSAQNSDSVLIAHFESDQERHCFNGVVASVDVVTHEKVVGVWGLPTNFEKLLQVMELTVNVTADSHWRADIRHVGFINEDFLSLNSTVTQVA